MVKFPKFFDGTLYLIVTNKSPTIHMCVCVCVCVCVCECQKMPRMIRTLLCNNYRRVFYCSMFTILKYTRIIQVQITCGQCQHSANTVLSTCPEAVPVFRCSEAWIKYGIECSNLLVVPCVEGSGMGFIEVLLIT